ncbi:MAG TPA: NADH-quinone oxidoreductase subunit C [Vicinamibacterales bacterium]|nr:NADH-quinone oxidoreductase subunit C [Vicinamibacterales bacterium]
MSQDPFPVIDVLTRELPEATFEAAGAVDMPTFYVDSDHVLESVRMLRDHPELQFGFLVDVTAVDYLPAEPRFEMVYILACLGDAFKTSNGPAAPPRRLRMKTRVADSADPRVASVTSVFPSANWPEREVFDLMGISFEGHPDLRRILTPEDWTGYPLRKDYPVQIRKDTASWSPVQLTPEEFAANVRAARERADKQAGRE